MTADGLVFQPVTGARFHFRASTVPVRIEAVPAPLAREEASGRSASSDASARPASANRASSESASIRNPGPPRLGWVMH